MERAGFIVEREQLRLFRIHKEGDGDGLCAVLHILVIHTLRGRGRNDLDILQLFRRKRAVFGVVIDNDADDIARAELAGKAVAEGRNGDADGFLAAAEVPKQVFCCLFGSGQLVFQNIVPGIEITLGTLADDILGLCDKPSGKGNFTGLQIPNLNIKIYSSVL